MVVDSVNFPRESIDTAGLLYDLFSNRTLMASKLPVLIACNKQGVCVCVCVCVWCVCVCVCVCGVCVVCVCYVSHVCLSDCSVCTAFVLYPLYCTICRYLFGPRCGHNRRRTGTRNVSRCSFPFTIAAVHKLKLESWPLGCVIDSGSCMNWASH